MRLVFLTVLFLITSFLQAQVKFEQLGSTLPTPNTYRTASGKPGPDYFQMKADYKIKVTLIDSTQQLIGEEIITYHNNSPETLDYLWLQLDQNNKSKDADARKINQSSVSTSMSTNQLTNMDYTFEGGFNIEKVTDLKAKSIPYVINKTMMRLDIPTPLKPGQTYSFKITWWYNVNDRMKIGGRSGYEYFEEDKNYLYTIAQFFPRMCVYDDINGWQNKQFLGTGEFALTFGDYEVDITVPDDHLVAATGTLQNPTQVLTKVQVERLAKAANEFTQPIIIATQEEAVEREKSQSKKYKTWKFKATNVRDFAFASSRKFIWDAMAVKQTNGNVMAMSMYPKEGNPLWEKFSTKAVAHTIKWYSHYTFEYPYPVAWSINADRIGMEYPMISFNFGRCEKDGTYSERTKYGMIGVIIHEVGHNYFPMIVNSDERQWSWMDEGLNTFLQYLTEQQWERDFPSSRGPAHKIVDYMKGDKSKLTPIMTNSENIYQFGNNAYGKPATALNILRETIMGRDLFDKAFKEYANRWKFKHPAPADFFRTMEDASAVDLDWFWRGWFYGTDPVDLSIKEVKAYKINPKDPTQKLDLYTSTKSKENKNISELRNAEQIPQTYDEIDPTIRDYYSKYDKNIPDAQDDKDYQKFLQSLTEDEKSLLNESDYYYEYTFENVGGLPMPIIFKTYYEDGTEELEIIPAEAWRFDNTTFTKTYKKQKKMLKVELDPYLETADINRNNNHFPPKQEENRFEIFKQRQQTQENPMQRANRLAKEKEDKP